MYIISNFHNNLAFIDEETGLREVKVLIHGHS